MRGNVIKLQDNDEFLSGLNFTPAEVCRWSAAVKKTGSGGTRGRRVTMEGWQEAEIAALYI